jgi:hypothetical protein
MATQKTCDFCGGLISDVVAVTGYAELDGTVIRRIVGPSGEDETKTYDACKACMDRILAIKET